MRAILPLAAMLAIAAPALAQSPAADAPADAAPTPTDAAPTPTATAPTTPGTSTAPATPTPSAERMAASRRVIDLILPPDHAADALAEMAMRMSDQMVNPIMESDQLKASLRANPSMRAPFNRFVARVREESARVIRDNAEGLRDAMVLVYAGRFDVAQLGDLEHFYLTPTGRLFASQSLEMPTDPAMIAWNQRVTTATNERLQPIMERFMREITSAAAKATSDDAPPP